MGRMSAYVLIGLPFFLAIVLSLLNPQFMSPLWNTGTGHKLIFGGLLMAVFDIGQTSEFYIAHVQQSLHVRDLMRGLGKTPFFAFATPRP